MKKWIVILSLISLLLMVGTVSAVTWGNTGVGTSNDLWALRTTTALLTAPSNISTLLSINYYSKDNSGTLDLKCGIWQTNGTLVANSITNVISGVNTTAMWRYANFSSQPTIIAGNSYLVGCVASDNYNNYYYVIGPGAPSQFRYGTVDYTTPGNFAEASNLNQVMSIYVEYTPTGGAPDTTPPASITNLANNTATCEQITYSWTNPLDADYNGSVFHLNGTQQFPNLTKTDTSKVFTGLTGGVEYTFSSRTFDNATPPNVNATWVNMTATPTSCVVAPVASFTLSKNFIRIPNSVTATDTSTSTPTSWQWSWGDGTANSTTQNPSHQYLKRGKWNITMTATNAGGSGSSGSTSVRVVGYETYT